MVKSGRTGRKMSIQMWLVAKRVGCVVAKDKQKTYDKLESRRE